MGKRVFKFVVWSSYNPNIFSEGFLPAVPPQLAEANEGHYLSLKIIWWSIQQNANLAVCKFQFSFSSIWISWYNGSFSTRSFKNCFISRVIFTANKERVHQWQVLGLVNEKFWLPLQKKRFGTKEEAKKTEDWFSESEESTIFRVYFTDDAKNQSMKKNGMMIDQMQRKRLKKKFVWFSVKLWELEHGLDVKFLQKIGTQERLWCDATNYKTFVCDFCK